MSLDALHDSECPSIYGRALGNCEECNCAGTAAKIAAHLENISYSLPSGAFDEVAEMIASLEAQRQEALRWLNEADQAIENAPHDPSCNHNDAPEYFNFICSCWKGEHKARSEAL